MRKLLFAPVLVLALVGLTAPMAWAGSPHFVGPTIVATRDGDNLVVTGREAGLGDELIVDLQATATLGCINPGAHHPKARNKEGVSSPVESTPVQNGHADFVGDDALTITPGSVPNCPSPMVVAYLNVTVTDLTNGGSFTLRGYF